MGNFNREVLYKTQSGVGEEMPLGMKFVSTAFFVEGSVALEEAIAETQYDPKTQLSGFSNNPLMGGSQSWKRSGSTFMTIRKDYDDDMQKDD